MSHDLHAHHMGKRWPPALNATDVNRKHGPRTQVMVSRLRVEDPGDNGDGGVSPELARVRNLDGSAHALSYSGTSTSERIASTLSSILWSSITIF